MKWLIVILFLFPAACLAQITISGRVINAIDKQSIINASVFLGNASIGNTTDTNGVYKLQNVRPGQYELVVSIVGFETHRQNVMVGADNIALPVIVLLPKTMQLKEVNIRPDADWEFYYTTFKNEFFGPSAMAKQCRILNPEVLEFDFDKKKRTLTASSEDFIIVENVALGYRIKYLLNKFEKNNRENRLYFEGTALFENLKGSKRQLKNRQRNREKAYEGSSMHFLRSVIGNNIIGNNFEVLRLVRKPNPDFNNGLGQDRYIQYLITTPLSINDFVSRTDNRGLFSLNFKDCLYVMYTKNKNATDKSIYRPLQMPNYPVTIVTFSEPHALFDANGIILNPSSLIFEGIWGNSRIAEMLPVDYTPEESK